MATLLRFLCLATFVLAATPTALRAANPNALWEIVHGRCVPDEANLHTPLPCTSLDTARGYAILKDRVGTTQFLLIPTARMSGVEDPAVLAPFARNYWQDAWDARNDVIAMAGRTLDNTELSLAINSKYGRSQNQFHIHIECISPAVRTALLSHAADITETWTRFPVPLAGHVYQVRSVRTLDRPGADPFRLVANGIPGARADMARQSILVTGAIFPGQGTGFYILETSANPATGNAGHAEELQDHDCALAQGS